MEVRDKPLILVVDDQATIIRIITGILKPTYDVCVATNGRKAIDVATQQLPDLILLDNLMPDMTGIEACIELRKIPETSQVPIIFISSMDDKHNEQMGFKAGADDYMYKPPTAELIMARVSVHLRIRKQRLFLEQLAAGDVGTPAQLQRAAQKLLE